MKEIECKTQSELEACCKDGNLAIVRSGNFTAYGSSQVRACDSSQVTACDSSQVTACGSSQATAYGSSQVTACGSSQVRAYGSSQVRACGSSQVTAYGSSQVRAYGSSQVRAYGSSQVRACDSSQVRATKQVAVSIHGGNTKCTGGVKIRITLPQTLAQWFGLYDIKPKDGTVVLFKAVDTAYNSPKGANYSPNTTPEAADWDGGKEECGGGLHFVPLAFLGLRYFSEAKRFMACPIKVKDIAFHKDASYPDKVKARCVCAPGCYEVDINGNRISAKQ